MNRTLDRYVAQVVARQQFLLANTGADGFTPAAWAALAAEAAAPPVLTAKAGTAPKTDAAKKGSAEAVKVAPEKDVTRKEYEAFRDWLKGNYPAGSEVVFDGKGNPTVASVKYPELGSGLNDLLKNEGVKFPEFGSDLSEFKKWAAAALRDAGRKYFEDEIRPRLFLAVAGPLADLLSSPVAFGPGADAARQELGGLIDLLRQKADDVNAASLQLLQGGLNVLASGAFNGAVDQVLAALWNTGKKPTVLETAAFNALAATIKGLGNQAGELLKDIVADPEKSVGDLLDALNKGIIDKPSEALTNVLDNFGTALLSGLVKGGAGFLFNELWAKDPNASFGEMMARQLCERVLDKFVDMLVKSIGSIRELFGNFQGYLDKVKAKIDATYKGETPEFQFLAAKMFDKDDKVDVVEVGSVSVRFDRRAAARIDDPMTPSKRLIRDGDAKVFTEGKPAAKLECRTYVPSRLVPAGGTVFINGTAAVTRAAPDMPGIPLSGLAPTAALMMSSPDDVKTGLPPINATPAPEPKAPRYSIILASETAAGDPKGRDYMGIGNPGHAAVIIVIDDPVTGQTRYETFATYPDGDDLFAPQGLAGADNDHYVNLPPGALGPNHLGDTPGRFPFQSTPVPITAAQYQMVVATATKPFDWALPNNCVDYAVDTYNLVTNHTANSIASEYFPTVPEYEANREYGGFVTSPRDLGAQIRDQNRP